MKKPKDFPKKEKERKKRREENQRHLKETARRVREAGYDIYSVNEETARLCKEGEARFDRGELESIEVGYEEYFKESLERARKRIEEDDQAIGSREKATTR